MGPYDVTIVCDACGFEEIIDREDADGFTDGCPDCGDEDLRFLADGGDDLDEGEGW